MYQINLPREFVNPPLYLLRTESKPKEMAKRLGLAMRPTLRQDIQIATRRVMGPRPVQVAAPRPAGGYTQRVAAPRPAMQRPAVQRPSMGVRATLTVPSRETSVEPGLPTMVSSGPVPQPMAMPDRAITVTPSSNQGGRKLFRYAPEGGFMQSVWRSGVAALAVRPDGAIRFTPAMGRKPRSNGGLI